MTWVDSIQELDFYSRGPNDYCYCDLLVQPKDLTIQGILRSDSTADVLKIFMYSPDGLTEIADVTSYFDWYIAKVSGRSFFIARLIYFPPLMCANRCFVLQAIVDYGDSGSFGQGQPRFKKMTQQYCLADCCVTPEEVSITGIGVAQHAAYLPTTISSPKDIMCRPLLRISVRFDCVDRYTGDYWQVPSPLLYVNGTTGADGMFAFTKVLNLAGTVLEQPRDLKRVVSMNCRVQRTETTRLYNVQSFEEFPLWKFNEISDMLHAPYLELNGRSYVFAGGMPFEALYPKRIAKRYFRLKFDVQDCLQFQLFGCSDRCSSDNLRYYAFKNQADLYYDDSGRFIGTTIDDVLDWFNSTGGGRVLGTTPTLPPFQEPIIWTARLVPPTEMAPPVVVDYYAVIEADGENLPAYIYGESTRPSNRVYAQELINGDYNGLFGVTVNYVPCKPPVTDTPTFTDMVCADPVVGTITFTDKCKLPVLGTPVYGDLDEVPTEELTFELEDESGLITTEDDDFIITE